MSAENHEKYTTFWMKCNREFVLLHGTEEFIHEEKSQKKFTNSIMKFVTAKAVESRCD